MKGQLSTEPMKKVQPTRENLKTTAVCGLLILGQPGAVSGDGEKSNFLSAVLDFFPSPLTAPGSPRMRFTEFSHT